MSEVNARVRELLALPAASVDSDDAIIQLPWYLSLILGVSAWVAGLCLLVFVAFTFKPDTAPAMFVCSVILLGAAFALYHVGRDGAFFSQLALAFSIAGQLLFVVGLVISLERHGRGDANIGAIALATFVLQVCLVFLMPSALHRTLSAFFACCVWAMTIRFGLFGEPRPFSYRPDALPVSLDSALLAWALTWLPVAGLLFVLIRREAQWMAKSWQPIVRPAMNGMLIGLAFATLVSQPFQLFDWRGTHAGNIGWLALWPLLSAFAAVCALTVGFALRSRAMMSLAIFGALLHVSHFYYVLGNSLLMKSLFMAVMGVAMLLAAYFLNAQDRAEGRQ